jgi:hypothetical protein
MTNKLQRQGKDSRPICNSPPIRRIPPQINHAPRNHKHNPIHILKILRNSIHTNEEARRLQFFGSGGPFHVHAKEVAEQGFGEVEGDPTEVEDDKRRPGYDLDCGVF